ncbi:MAG: hypothetical protein MK212_06030 [Saprospiraceae bacterium]|nr:hypothetical protein [Saprospiraceae bacterium]
MKNILSLPIIYYLLCNIFILYNAQKIHAQEVDYWLKEAISSELYRARVPSPNCTVQYIYNRKNDLVHSFDDPTVKFIHKGGNLYAKKPIYDWETTVIKPIQVSIGLEEEYYEGTIYYHYHNGKLQPLDVDYARIYTLDNQELIWTFAKNKAELLDKNLNIRLKIGKRILDHYGDYYWLIDTCKRKINIYSTDNEKIKVLSGKEYNPHFYAVSNGIWALGGFDATTWDLEFYLYNEQGRLSEDGFNEYHIPTQVSYRAEKSRKQTFDVWEDPHQKRKEYTQADTSVIRVNNYYYISSDDGKSFYEGSNYGLRDLETGTEILAIKYDYIRYMDYGRFLIKDNYGEGLIEIRDKRIHILIPTIYRSIKVVSKDIALVQEGKYWYLYNIAKQKCSTVEFATYDLVGDNLYLERFGKWTVFNLQKQQFDFLLGEVDKPIEVVNQTAWLSANYEAYLPVIYGESEKEPATISLLFRNSDLSDYRLKDRELLAAFTNPQNLNQTIMVQPEYRADVYNQYLLYQDDKGFHLVDTSGKYYFVNQQWKAAIFLKLRDTKQLHCLVLDEKGIGIYDVSTQEISYHNIDKIDEVHGMTHSGQLKLITNYQSKKGCIAFYKETDHLLVLAALYDKIHKIKVDIDGNYLIKISENQKTYWVNEDGDFLSDCD